MHETIEGWSHVALSVTDLGRSLAFYGEVLGFRPLVAFSTDDFDRQVVAHPSGVVLALTAHAGTPGDDAFDPRRVGVDHVSLRVGSVADLDAWAVHLDERGIAHGEVVHTAELGSVQLATWDPDGIQVELYVHVGAA